jgi:hypothetical protein
MATRSQIEKTYDCSDEVFRAAYSGDADRTGTDHFDDSTSSCHQVKATKVGRAAAGDRRRQKTKVDPFPAQRVDRTQELLLPTCR